MTTPAIIIIFEADPMIAGALRVELGRWDHTVLLTSSCEEAWAIASAAVAGLVVLDVTKPQIDAYETCARIRRMPGYAARPIVLTGWDISERSQAAARMAGATALLRKPYSMLDLFQAITPHLRPDDPLLVAGPPRAGMAAPTQEWKQAATLEWLSGPESALARNRWLLPIVRGTGKKIPFGGKIS